MKSFLLHGMGGAPGDWARVQEFFPGEAIALPAAPSFDALVEVLRARFTAEEAPFALVGYSLGGRITIALTAALLRAGHPPARIALLGAGFGFASEEERRAREESDLAWAALIRRDPVAFWNEWYAQPLFAGFRGLAAREKAEWLAARRTMSPESLARQWEAWGPSQHGPLKPFLDKIARAGIPCLYLAGERDTKYRSIAEKLAGEGMRTLLIPGAGHLLPLEAPGPVGEALRQFVEGN